MIVYYENMNGEKLNLLKAPFRTTKTDWFDADWSESSDGYEKTVTIDVFGKREEFQANMEQLYRIIAVDAENDTYGKLYVNGAMVSEKHSGFVINYDNATATDIINLMKDVRKKVYEEFQVTLEPEVKILPAVKW